MKNPINYFAFGSNLNYNRLRQRIGEFSILGVACLSGHQLVFHKQGGDRSGKCTVINHPDHNVWGVIYGINPDQKQKLDYFEGVGHGYSAVYHDVEQFGISVNALLYQAQLDAMDDGLLPFDWYKAYVLSGARYHQLPEGYIEQIELTPSICDPDPQRSANNTNILNGVF
jgi:hypothetical protein